MDIPTVNETVLEGVIAPLQLLSGVKARHFN